MEDEETPDPKRFSWTPPLTTIDSVTHSGEKPTSTTFQMGMER